MQAMLAAVILSCATAATQGADTVAQRPARVTLSYTGQAATNPVGGQRQDSAYAGRFVLRTRIDLQDALGLNGEIDAIVTHRHGQELSAIAIGNNTSVQEIYGPQQTSLGLLAYRGSYLDRRVEFEAGRLVANTAFLSSPLYCHFQSNAMCPSPTFIFKTSNFTFFPAPSWGAHVKLGLAGGWYVHAGAYEVNPEQKRATADGLDWSTRGATGVVVPYELGYVKHRDEPRERHYRFGGWFDTGEYTDPSRDERGDLAALTGEPRATRSGRSGLFAQLEQAILARDALANRRLTAFAVVMTTTSGRTVEDDFYAVGLVQQGVFRRRGDDTLAFVFSEQRFSRWALENGRAARSRVGGIHEPPHGERMLELAYGLQLTPNLRISPNIQYIVRPDQMSDPFRARDTPDALVFGVEFSLDDLRLRFPSHRRSQP